MIVIATSRAYLLAEKIVYMNVEPYQGDDFRRGNNLVQIYNIAICFRPTDSQNQNNMHNMQKHGEEQFIMNIRVQGEKPALTLFKDLVNQIREQCPDQAYLDKMVEQILSGAKEDVHDDTSTTKVRKPRKKTRRR